MYRQKNPPGETDLPRAKDHRIVMDHKGVKEVKYFIHHISNLKQDDDNKDNLNLSFKRK
jgi:hypothetical protein